MNEAEEDRAFLYFIVFLGKNKIRGSSMDRLKKYKEKRDFTRTKEPVGKKEKTNKKLRFVVQHHMARREHYDFRLEWKGVLLSWAVPKGPSYNTQDKRLAVHVEDHPLSYRNFEGVIPKGEYGGGTVMLWDTGTFDAIEDFSEGLKKGSLKFILHGNRLQGKWTLVFFKDDNWLLIKEKDNVKKYDSIIEYKTSIKTGRTMEEIANNEPPKKRNSKKDNMIESVKITNPDKVIYKTPKITKMDIVLYYQKIAKHMLPFIENRIISTIRCPSGSEGECFFKKHLETKSEGIGKKILPSDKGNKEDYYYIKDSSGLISEVQMNSYEFHVWGSKADKINSPDILVFDLDPDEGMSLKKVREGVLDLKSILDELHLKSFLKTSGGKGYHVVVPTKKLKTWKLAREFSQNIAKLMEVKWPSKYTSNIRKKMRKGKIFIDWVRNTKSATSVAPYSIRIRKKARVSMPIKWSELDKVKPDGITIADAIKRLKRKDPWENFFTLNQ